MAGTYETDICTPFVISSKTRQHNINHPELCWMDVPEWKLSQAVAMRAEVRLEYHHHVDGEYVCSFVYELDARTLQELFGGHPENCSLPPKPPHYRRLSWLKLPKFNI